MDDLAVANLIVNALLLLVAIAGAAKLMFVSQCLASNVPSNERRIRNENSFV